MNILIIGLGSIGRKHLNSLKKIIPNGKIFALRSNKNHEQDFDIINVYNFHEIVEKLAFVIISNPTFIHEETIIKCLKFNCPLFIEKPVLQKIENSNFISCKIKELNIKTYIACNLRFHPAIMFLKNLTHNIKNNIIEVNVYCGSFLPNWRLDSDYRKNYSSSKKLGGGVHLDLIHEIDYCYWLFGKPENVYSTFRKVSKLDIDSYDFASYTLIYKNFTINIILNYYRIYSKREIELILNDDILIVDLLENTIFSKLNNRIIFTKKYSITDTYDNQMQYFIDKIYTNSTLMNNFDEAIDVLKLALNE